MSVAFVSPIERCVTTLQRARRAAPGTLAEFGHEHGAIE
jgi:hypothetical protein